MIVLFLAMEKYIGRQKNCILSLGLYILRLRIYKLRLSFYILNLSIENLMRKRWVFVAKWHKKTLHNNAAFFVISHYFFNSKSSFPALSVRMIELSAPALNSCTLLIASTILSSVAMSAHIIMVRIVSPNFSELLFCL